MTREIHGALQRLTRPIRAHLAPERQQRLRVGHGAMTVLDHDSVAFHHGVEVVTRHLGVQRARQSHRAQVGAAPGSANRRELAPDESVVEAHVVRNEYAPLEPLAQLSGDALERRRVEQHFVVDAGQCGDARGDVHARIDERLPLEVHAIAGGADHGDVDDAVQAQGTAGRFDIDEGDP